MSTITNKNGKIVLNKNSSHNATAIQTSRQTNWIKHTKQFSSNNNISYSKALSDTNNRCQYYDTMIDRKKFDRGPHLLQPDHPAMHPFIPNLSPQNKKIKDEIFVQTKRVMCGKTPSFKTTKN
jgi:hypothetical protein